MWLFLLFWALPASQGSMSDHAGYMVNGRSAGGCLCQPPRTVLVHSVIWVWHLRLPFSELDVLIAQLWPRGKAVMRCNPWSHQVVFLTAQSEMLDTSWTHFARDPTRLALISTLRRFCACTCQHMRLNRSPSPLSTKYDSMLFASYVACGLSLQTTFFD